MSRPNSPDPIQTLALTTGQPNLDGAQLNAQQIAEQNPQLVEQQMAQQNAHHFTQQTTSNSTAASTEQLQLQIRLRELVLSEAREQRQLRVEELNIQAQLEETQHEHERSKWAHELQITRFRGLSENSSVLSQDIKYIGLKVPKFAEGEDIDDYLRTCGVSYGSSDFHALYHSIEQHDL